LRCFINNLIAEAGSIAGSPCFLDGRFGEATQTASLRYSCRDYYGRASNAGSSLRVSDQKASTMCKKM
jgi:hypothetical protein